MANEEHLAILRQGVEVWNQWRKKNSNVIPDLSKANFSKYDFSKIDLSKAILIKTDFSDTNLFNANLFIANVKDANFKNSNLVRADLRDTKLGEANLSYATLAGAILRRAILSGANLSRHKLIRTDLTKADLSDADLSNADLRGACLSRTQALGTNLTGVKLTGACLEDWHINKATKLDNVDCQYIYLSIDKQERCPYTGNFNLGEFTKLFQKSLETIDLIFRNGIDWDAFAYSFKKVEVKNQGAQLDVQSIEKKGDGILVVRVSVAPDADKAKIHNQFMQGYEFAAKALEAQYQVRLEDKDLLISKQEAQINRLFDIVEQQGSVQKALAENPRKVSNYNIQNPQFASGIVDANTVDAQQIGGNIQNNDA
ncbi:pentapeptide repeat-containing protein [Nostoc sp.]|uniref:pentapeptide repeat-containing protein n=1 Tax=Nostoc sp. TaxID=1180 RepID=UPI002FFA76C9